jgi:hypothetical protein
MSVITKPGSTDTKQTGASGVPVQLTRQEVEAAKKEGAAMAFAWRRELEERTRMYLFADAREAELVALCKAMEITEPSEDWKRDWFRR